MELIQIQDDLQTIVEKNQTYLMHLSYKSLGMTGVHPQDFINVLKEVFRESTLIIPMHTWSTVGSKTDTCDYYDDEQICVGVVPRLWSKTEGVFRNLHPTHSVGIYGVRRAEYEEACNVRENTPCGMMSPYRKIMEDRGKVLLVGVDFSVNTIIHGMEEWNRMGIRLSKQTKTMYVKKGNERHAFQMRGHDNANSDMYVKLEKNCEDLGIMKKIKIGAADTMLVDVFALHDLVAFYMKYNDDYLGFL